jgi:predicted nucleotidyltransferase
LTLDAVTDAVRHVEHRLRPEFGVAALYVFGSVARGEARADSDIDVLVEFEGPPTFARLMDLKALLEDTLGAPVDPVTRAALRTQLKPRIEAEARRVAAPLGNADAREGDPRADYAYSRRRPLGSGMGRPAAAAASSQS